MSQDNNSYFVGGFSVTILFKSKQLATFDCESFQIVDAETFRYTFRNLVDEDGPIAHFNYDPVSVDAILINHLLDEDEDEEEDDEG